MSYHKLLLRQINKYLPEALRDTDQLRHFLEVVSQSYSAMDKERELSERAFHITETEYNELNQTLQNELTVKRQSIEKLKETMEVISGVERINETDDLLIIARYLSNQVSKRKNAEKVFTSLITNLQSGILLEDETRHIVFANQHFCDLFGIPAAPEQLQGADCSNSAEQAKDMFADPVDFVSGISKLLTEKKLATGEMLLLADGRIYQRDYIPIYTDNIYKGHLWSYTDITGKKKAQDAIAESESRNRLIMNAALDAIITIDMDGIITFWNPQATNIFGWSEQEAIGQQLSRLIIPEEFRTHHERGMQRFRETGEGPALNKPLDLPAIKKNGEQIRAELSIIPVKQGDTYFFCAFIRDITEREKNKAELLRLSLVASANHNGVLFTTTTGEITWANEGFCQLTGFCLQEIIGKTPVELCKGPLTNTDELGKVLHAFSKGLSFNTELIYYRKDQSWFWGRSSSQPVKNSKGQIVEYFGIIEDITSEKESEQHFRIALEKIGDNVWEHDFETGRTWFSKSTHSLLGHDNQNLDHNQKLWWQSVHVQDLKMLADNDLKYKAGEIDSHILEYRIIHEDGSVRWVLDRGVVTESDKEGKPLKITGTHTDITHIKQTEAELENRLRQFKSLSENIPGVIYEYEFRKDGTEGLRYVSPAINKIFGIESGDFYSFQKYIHPDDLPLVIAKNKNSRDTLEPFYVESRLLIPGRDLIWQSVTSSFSYYTPEGDIVFTGFMLDITERKNSEQKLEAQRKFYEDILNNIPADIAVFSPTHEYLFVNPRGIKDDALRKWIIGKRDEDYCHYRNKPLSIAEGRRTAFNKMVSSKSANEWEEKNMTPDGKEQYILRRWYPVLDAAGEVELVIGYGVDITERKMFEKALQANEEKYRDIIANMNLGLMELDTDTRILYANQGMLAMTGIGADEAIGYDSSKLLPPESMALMNEKTDNRRNGISEAYEVQVRIGNELKWWLVSAAPKFDREGSLIGSIVVCLDIHDRKELEKQLIIERERAEQLAHTKELFLANMSHEIRTPMNAIIGMGSQLSRTSLSEQQRFYLKAINSAADNLLIIINDILDLSKIEAGKLSIEKIGFEPRKVMEHAMQVLMYKAEEKGIGLTYSFCDARLAGVLVGDPYRINQVLLNLISNAIKFTEKGVVDISLRLLKDNGRTQLIKAEVKDSGIGMEEEFVKRVFDKFSQEYESVTRKYGGTGLGMSIIKELITLMGGSVLVESKKGEGTTVSFTLELEIGTASDLPQKETLEVNEDELKGKMIMVVDDNELNRLVATTIVEVYGATTVEAENGRQAVDMLDTCKPDVVLMDIQMPLLNGLDASREIRKKGNQVPIIALTANAIRGESEKCLQAGMNDYIAKPFREEELLKIIAKWLGKHIETKLEIPVTTMGAELFSLKKLEEISRGNNEFVKRMISLFVGQVPAATAEIMEAYKEHDMEKVKSIAHRIKPTIDNLEIHSLKNEIREIETLAAKMKPSARLENLIQFLQDVIVKVALELKEQQKEDSRGK
ncbi:MAG: PAS domain S-box protein [Bacteroidetes bacterium]|nr:PAS domain S-box protein [Bacteroidota bacterium]